MNMPPALQNAARRFDALTLRERVLTTTGVLAVVFMLWQTTVMDPLSAHKARLTAELDEVQNGITATANALDPASSSDPLSLAIGERSALQKEIAATDATLESKAAGLIPPQKMIGVVRDVLEKQHRLKLVSLRNAAVHPLAVPTDPTQAEAGPYVHPVELVVEGNYFDVLAYLRALEALPWRFYWKTFDLNTTRYPNNRVRIELSTLSMERAWLGV
jgi:MSHA biogenesis protein MshJ